MKNGEYILVKAPVNYPGKKYRGKYCYEHHLVWWKHNNTLPKKDFCIHHLNENKQDNRIENLKLISKSEHCLIHSEGVTMVEYTCKNCGVKFERRKGLTGVFCSRRCVGLYCFHKT